MSQASTNIATTPTGRLMWGDLYTPNEKNMTGQPLMTQAGQPRKDYSFGLAIPKTQTDWRNEPWGKVIYLVGYQAFPNAYQNPRFSWKIIDGDSMEPNERGNKPAEQEGYPGHWILRFGSSFAPDLFTLVGKPAGARPEQLVQKDAIQPGDYVQVNFNIDGNKQAAKPGVYLNHGMVCLIAYGPRISRRNGNPETAGFGHAGALPANASTMPPGEFAPAPQPAPQPAPAPAPVAAPPPMPVVPHPTILAGPAPAVPPPAAPVRAMTAKAAGATYESFIAQGWTDARLVQHGYMAP